jgi:serine/threonine protein phosphatase PrpC
MSASPTTVAPPVLTAHGLTHPGQKRSANEDTYGCFPADRLFVVADGMGGHNAGEVASQIAVDEISAFFRRYHDDPRQVWPHPVDRKQSLGANLLRVGIKVANDKIRASAEEDRARARMACTVVAMAIGDTQLSIVHAGDARAYRIRGSDVKRLTIDHSVLAEMIAARPGMTEEEIAAFAHRNIVTKALGSKPEVDPTVYVGRIQPHDRFLLCSDGLWGAVRDEQIAAILATYQDLDAACQVLVDAANEAGGPDNITALLVRVG